MQSRRRRAGTLVVVTIVMAGASSVVPGHAAEPDAVPAALIEATVCAEPTPLPAVTDARTDGATRVAFAVPNQTWVKLGANGDEVAASTNTGCRPRSIDQVTVMDADGIVRPATADEIERAVAGFQSGDWREPGVWHSGG